MSKENAKNLRDVMGELRGVIVTLDALANEGREDRRALEMLSHVVDGAFMRLDEIAEAMESGEGVA